MTSLVDAIKGFILEKQACGRSRYTIRDYEVHLRRFAQYCNGKALEHVSAQEIREFFVWYREEFRITHRAEQSIREPRPLSSKTIRNGWAALSSFWSWATVEFDLGQNPFSIPCPKARTQPVEPLTREQVERLLAFAGIRDRALFLTLLDTGARVGELCNAAISDLDLDNGRLLLRVTKGDKPRVAYLGCLARKALWAYLTRTRGTDAGPLFRCRSNRSGMTRNAVRLALQRLGRKAGVEGCHPHKLRHTFALAFLRNGGNVFLLQQLLGHADLRTSRKYLKLVESDAEEAHRRASPADNWRLR